MIVAGEKLSYGDNYSYFEELINKSILILKDLRFEKNDLLWKRFENESFQALKKVQECNQSEPYAKWNIELVSGHKFPDITAEITNLQKFGIEVKTTQDHKWSTLGGSIMESTRVENVDRINILFATLNPFEIKTKRFEDCISDVSVTHSPRYVINLDISKEETIFHKMGITYDQICKSDKPFSYFRDYFKKKSQQNGTDLWFIYEDDTKALDVEEMPTLEIKFYADLSDEEKENLFIKIIIYRPEVFAKETNDKIYKDIAMYLLNMGILNTSLRDVFSAGSRVCIDGISVPSKINRLIKRIPLVLEYLSKGSISKSITSRYGTMDASEILDKWQKLILEQLNYDCELYKLVSKKFDSLIDHCS